MFRSQKPRLSSLLLLVIALLMQSCASTNIYHGPAMNPDSVAVLRVIDKETSISNIDGKATTSRFLYAIKGRFEQELTILPGKHEIYLIHGGWRETSSKALYELETQKGYTYLVQSKTIGKSTSLWFEDEKSKERVGRLLASSNEPVTETTRLNSFDVFSFLPPQEDGWIILKRFHDEMSLFREGPKEDESFVISVVSKETPTFKNEKEFAEAVDASRNRALNNMPMRFKSLESKIDAGDPSDFCFDSYSLVEDHDATRKSSRKDMMLIETAHRTCRHPSNQNIFVHIYLSHRYYPTDKDSDLMAKAQNVFQSLKYK